MGKPQKIEDLLNQKQKIEKQIKHLQETCEHTHKTIKFIKENVDSSTFIIRWVCDECSSVVGIPNKDELDSFLKK